MEEMQKQNLTLGVFLILLSAFMTSMGQFLWKVSGGNNFIIIFGGFALYGLGAITMTLSFHHGEISVLHPMLGVSIVLSMIYGAIFLDEQITIGKITGAVLIIAGLVCLGISGRRGEQTI